MVVLTKTARNEQRKLAATFFDAPNAVRRAQSPLSRSSAAERRCRDVSKGRKFGEHRHRVARSAFVVVQSLASGLPRCLAFLSHEAMVAGLLTWAVGGRPVLGTPQDDRALRSRRRDYARIRRRFPYCLNGLHEYRGHQGDYHHRVCTVFLRVFALLGI